MEPDRSLAIVVADIGYRYRLQTGLFCLIFIAIVVTAGRLRTVLIVDLTSYVQF